MQGLPSIQRTEIANTRPIVQMPTTGAGSAWAGLADAAAQLSSVIDKEAEAAKQRYIAQMEVDIQTRAVELRDEYNHNPGGFEKAWDEYTAGTLSSVPGYLQKAAGMALKERSNQVMNTLNSEKRTRDRQLAIDTLNTRLEVSRNELWAEAYNNGTTSPRFLELAAQVQNIGQSSVNLGLKTQEASDLLVDTMLDRAKTEAAVGGVKKLYRAKGEEAALQYLEDTIRDPSVNLTPSERDSIIARGTSIVNGLSAKDKAAVAKVHAEASASLDLNIEKAILSENTERLNALYAEAEAAPYLTPSQRTDRQVKILKAQDNLSTSIRDMAQVEAQLSGIPLIDPTDTNDIKKVDTYFEKSFLPQISDGDFTSQISKTMDFVQRTNVVPDALKRQLVGGMAGGTPELKAAMADQIVQIVEEAPFTKRAFNEQTLAKAYHISDLAKAGVDMEEAVRQAEEAEKVSEPVQQMRTQIAREDKHLQKNQSFLTKQSAVGGFFNDIDVPDEMLAEYNDIQGRMFKRTGNLEASQKAAWSSLQNVWGVTEIGPAGKRWQKYAPEAYNPFEGDAGWMREQLMQDVQTKYAFDPDKGNLDKRIMLLPDNTTSREAGAGTTPSWPVWILDDDGIAKPLLDENGNQSVFRPDFKKTEQYRSMLQEKEELENFDLQELRTEFLKQREQGRNVEEWHGNVMVSPRLGD